MGTRTPKASVPQPDSDPRERFLDEASHELRTPITALKGQIQLMQRRFRRDPARQDDLVDIDKMLYYLQRLNHQLDVFLAASHIQQKRYALLLAPCDIVAIVRHLVGIYAAGASIHAIHFESSVDELVGDWDRRRIEEAVAALLANAIKYSPRGEILVTIAQTGDLAHIEVRDGGIGVPARERSAIFRAYTTGTRGESAGVGLGLYIAQEAIKRQHGRIGVRSASPKPGSIFWFELPLTQPVVRRSLPSSSSNRPKRHQQKAAPATTGTESAGTSTSWRASPSLPLGV